MSGKSMPSDDWQPCPSGEISRLARSLRRKRRQRWTVLVVAPSLLVVAVMAIGLWLPVGIKDRIPSEPTYGGIACSQVRKIAPEYAAGLRPRGCRGQSASTHRAVPSVPRAGRSPP